MAKKVREESIPLINYVEDVKEEEVSGDQDVQRCFCSDKQFINGIGVTILTGDYLAPLILAEVPLAPFNEGIVQRYIADGFQRTTALMEIRYGNHKFTGNFEGNEIEYQTKVVGDDGKCIKDEDGHFVWEKKIFNIKNKTYDDFPKELQKKFDNYQLRIATYQDCTMEDVSKLVRKLNMHRAMNANQRALTWIPTYARKIKTITKSQFFANCVTCSDTNRKNGVYEQAVCNSVMTVFHEDEWKKAAKSTSQYLEENSNNEEFETINKYMIRIEKECKDTFQDIFTMKNLHIWIAVFDKFNNYHIDDKRFAQFVQAFRDGLHSKKINGVSFDELDTQKNTKDKKTITEKINLLCDLMKEFLGEEIIELPEEKSENDGIETVLDFVKENVNDETNDEDIALYEDCVMEYIKIDSNLYKQCEKALIALMAYACNKDKDTEFGDWIQKYANANETYSNSQKINYTYFKHDFDKYLSLQNGAVA